MIIILLLCVVAMPFLVEAIRKALRAVDLGAVLVRIVVCAVCAALLVLVAKDPKFGLWPFVVLVSWAFCLFYATSHIIFKTLIVGYRRAREKRPAQRVKE